MADFNIAINLRANDLGASRVIAQMTGNLRGFHNQLAGATGRGRRGQGGEIGLQNLASGFQQAGAAVNTLTRSARGVLEPIISEGVQFERSMAEVLAFGGTKFAPFMEQLHEQARQLGRDTEFTAVQTASSMRQLAQAGMTPEQIMGALPQVLNLAKAGALDLSRAAEITSATMNQFDLQAHEVVNVVDLLSTAANSSQTNVGQVGQALRFVGSTANLMNISLEDTSVLLAGLGKTAIQSGKAGRGLNALFVGLADFRRPTAKKVFKALNIDLKELGRELETGEIIPAIKRMRKGFEEAGLSGDKQVSMLTRIFGRIGGRTAAALVSADAKGQLDELSEAMDNARGAGERMAEIMRNTTRGDILRAESALSDLKLTIASELLPAMRPLLGDAVELTKAFSNWVDENRDLIRTYGPLILKLVAFGTVAGPVLQTLGSLFQLTSVFGNAASVAGQGITSLATSAGMSAKMLGRMRLAGAGVGVALAGAGIIIAKTRMEVDALNASVRQLARDTERNEKSMAKNMSDVDLAKREQRLKKQAEAARADFKRRQADDDILDWAFGTEAKDTAARGIEAQLEAVQIEQIKRKEARREAAVGAGEVGLIESVSQVNKSLGGKQAMESAKAVEKILSQSKIQVGLNVKVDQSGRVIGVEQTGDGLDASITTGLLTEGL